ncbi:hypothetical protein ACI2L1_25765 [Streptomyces sp. NPDC019531]|uniref:hypothetical protein n=1 Tax=Streptomyces sp. NPDC019531 TaxID=3365062 RepID=UPI00384D3262
MVLAPGKPLLIGLPLVLLVGGMAGLFLAEGLSSGYTAANRAQVKSACGGLLPYDELRSLVPDEIGGEASQYGTVLEPGEESRSLAEHSAKARGCSAPAGS